MSVCIWLCTIVLQNLHNTAENRSDNLPSYHHSSDGV